MAKEFDVCLNNRLTECDVIVYSIPYRDGLTVMDKLTLQACFESLLIQKFIAVHTQSSLVSDIDCLIKACAMRLDHRVSLTDQLGNLQSASSFAADNSVVLTDEVHDLLYRIEYEAEAAIQLSSKVKTLESSLSFGRTVDSIQLDDLIVATLASKLLDIRHHATLWCNAVCSTIASLSTPSDDVGLGIEVDFVLQRYRRLDEMDDKFLSDFDDMQLYDVDMVTT